MTRAALALRVAGGAITVLWWLPTLVLAVARPIAWHAAVAYRQGRTARLLNAGRLDEADRVIQRLRGEMEAVRRRRWS